MRDITLRDTLRDDIIADILDRLAGTLSADARASIEAAIRRDWGGDRPYIARAGESARAVISHRNAAIARDFHRGDSITLIARRYGISRRRCYQILSMPASAAPGDTDEH